MPVQPTYPGVYVEEIPSGVRTIIGVPTSITAFIGKARFGPVNEPILINSYADYERLFGGLWLQSNMSYAVRDFYQNGGSQAIIVRLVHNEASQDKLKAQLKLPSKTALKAKEAALTVAVAAYSATPADSGQLTAQDVKGAIDGAVKKIQDDSEKTAAQHVATEAGNDKYSTPDQVIQAAIDAAASYVPSNDSGSLTLEAANEGTWGNQLHARVEYYDNLMTGDMLKSLGVKSKEEVFNLVVYDMASGATEKFINVSVNSNSPRRLDKVLHNDSQLVRVSGSLPTERPLETDSVLRDELKDDNTTIDKNTKKIILRLSTSSPFATKASDLVNIRSFGVEKGGEATDKTDNDALDINDFTGSELESQKKGLYALEKADIFNILCIPPYTLGGDVDASLISEATEYCQKRRAILLVDAPSSWKDPNTAKNSFTNDGVGTRSNYAALFFPRIRKTNPLRDNQLEDFAPCGTVAGIFARTDAQRGVWKAPAGQDATLNGVHGLSVPLTNAENGELNPLGINCLRNFPIIGTIVWGARTLRGADQLADDYKYIPVRRLALFIEESLYRGTQWVVFEPNDEPLWAQIRLNVGAFMHNLFRQGAFQGKSPRDAYFVKCDSETTTQNDINQGIVNIVVGYAPLKPAEFVIIQIQQISGQILT